MPSPYPAARVAVDERTWQDFRHAALVRGIPVSTYLGKLVHAEVERRRATPVAHVSEHHAPHDTALDALAAVRASIDELDDIAGRLARVAAEGGASWDSVGSALRLRGAVARSAYSADSG